MNKSELIASVAGRLDGDRKAATAAVEGVLDEITRALVKGDRVVLTGFGTFEKRARPARTARNPRTGETVKVKKTAVPAFKPGATLKGHVSGATKLPRVAATAKKAAATVPAKKPTVRTVAKKAPAKTATKAAAKKAPAKTASKSAAKKAPAKKATSRSR